MPVAGLACKREQARPWVERRQRWLLAQERASLPAVPSATRATAARLARQCLAAPPRVPSLMATVQEAGAARATLARRVALQATVGHAAYLVVPADAHGAHSTPLRAASAAAQGRAAVPREIALRMAQPPAAAAAAAPLHTAAPAARSAAGAACPVYAGTTADAACAHTLALAAVLARVLPAAAAADAAACAAAAVLARFVELARPEPALLSSVTVHVSAAGLHRLPVDQSLAEQPDQVRDLLAVLASPAGLNNFERSAVQSADVPGNSHASVPGRRQARQVLLAAASVEALAARKPGPANVRVPVALGPVLLLAAKNEPAAQAAPAPAAAARRTGQTDMAAHLRAALAAAATAAAAAALQAAAWAAAAATPGAAASPASDRARVPAEAPAPAKAVAALAAAFAGPVAVDASNEVLLTQTTLTLGSLLAAAAVEHPARDAIPASG